MIVIDKAKVLDEKRQMQKIFERANGRRCPVLSLVITHYEGLEDMRSRGGGPKEK